ncbi:hypothetical protein QN372_20725 [Undibacterium sp. RTI2.1]|uniref:hypothetical protein n=1 Tax=unclassified Undibacterium TaxID=2630295 RepID=UPI002B2395EA|nr:MULTISPECIES: hypothetical protein [unclassified Undibacterium]MEB0033167.1 hypothetical protein [Undibacterium sp. RTI2.1]MEB0118967.1 hypothetical protein [Undibacterium sp. RTI2.2]
MNELTCEEISVKYAVAIAKARARLEKMRPIYNLATEKWAHVLKDSSIDNGIMAGAPQKCQKSKVFGNEKI